ncbi:MAG: hypothetical protein HY821_25040 [Acidobacteria bacterium]|nr:hypothetical protein [Acidobacteriota bacterium]
MTVIQSVRLSFADSQPRQWISLLVACTLLSAQLAPARGQQSAAPAPARTAPAQPGQPAKPPAAAKPAQPAPPKDAGWPRVYTDNKATIAVHQPQIDDWKDFTLLKARSAVEIIPEPKAKKILAAVHWEARTDTSVSERTVAIHDFKITRLSAPGLDEAQSTQLQALVAALLPKRRDGIALDRVLAYLDASQTTGRQIQINTEPPPIMVSSKPAILVIVDGEPILGPIGESKLMFIVNTNWDILKDGKDGHYFLLNGKQWLTSETLEGPWKSASKLPKDFNSLPADENWAEVKRALPLPDTNKHQPAPWVFLSQKPAELILTQGEPAFKPIPNTDLSEVTNTKSLLFYHNSTKTYYFLTAGRWFRNANLRGVWEYASDKLPADFRNIPPNHPKAVVLASVPGTPEAADAVLLASVPQIATINRAEAAKLAKVTYVGKPEFKPIDGTALSYAVNTPGDVIFCKGQYYLLQEGVWFVSATAEGPWAVADAIPKEIYEIPPSSPKHNTTYVYVTDSDSSSVTTAQTAGYLGMAIGVGIGVAVWGTGYYYPPYYYYGAMYPYPIYWGYPYCAYGAAAWYNPATGFYGRGAVAYGPYGGYGRAAAYNPVTGAYARRAGAYGPYQAATAGSFYNPRTGTRGAGYRYANPYQGWGQGVVARGDQWARGGYYYDERGAIGGIRTSEGGKLIAGGDGNNRGMIGKTADGDLYVGKNGEIYRRDQNGNWQQRGDGGWNNVNPPNAQQQQRINDARANAGQAAQNRQQPGQQPSRQPGQAAQPGQLNRENLGSRQLGQPGQPGQLNRDNLGNRSGSGLSEAQRESMRNLDRDAAARSRGNRNYDSWRSLGGGRSSGSFGGARGGFGGGGMRGGGRRR